MEAKQKKNRMKKIQQSILNDNIVAKSIICCIQILSLNIPLLLAVVLFCILKDVMSLVNLVYIAI